jgi:hypothetical protein
MFSDTHTMMIIGFGFLYTLMRKYAWSGVSWNYLITAFVIQWAVLMNGFWERVVDKVVRASTACLQSFALHIFTPYPRRSMATALALFSCRLAILFVAIIRLLLS